MAKGALTLQRMYGAELAPIDQVRILLEQELDPKRVSEFSQAVEAAKKLDSKNSERRNYWAELSIWSKRRLGVLIEEGQRDGWILKGRPEKGSHDESLSADDIAERHARSRAKSLASIDEEDLREAIDKLKASDEVSLAAVMKAVKCPHVANNSGEFEWYTPPEYIESARQVMGGIDLDPCTSDVAQAWIKAKRFYTADDDGLSKPWKGRIWLTPPYESSLVAAFIKKLIESCSDSSVKQAIVLVNNATDTRWCQLLGGGAAAICFVAGRIKFHDRSGSPAKTPLQGQAAFYLGCDADASHFCSVFDQHGFCVEGLTS